MQPHGQSDQYFIPAAVSRPTLTGSAPVQSPPPQVSRNFHTANRIHSLTHSQQPNPSAFQPVNQFPPNPTRFIPAPAFSNVPLSQPGPSAFQPVNQNSPHSMRFVPAAAHPLPHPSFPPQLPSPCVHSVRPILIRAPQALVPGQGPFIPAPARH